MKKLIVATVAAAMAFGAIAAQCKGLTQKGERCKRESAEGSEYCIGHADQAKQKETATAKPEKADFGKKCEKPAAKTEAKATAKTDAKADAKPEKKPDAKADAKAEAKPAEKGAAHAKELDDGTCWAMTESGKRCKRRKVEGSDYCKQHGVDVKPSKPLDRCRAITYDGTQCVRKPVEGGRYCKQHGGKEK